MNIKKGIIIINLLIFLVVTSGLTVENCIAKEKDSETTVISNAIYSWWIQPIAVNYGSYSFIGSLSEDGTPHVSKIQIATGRVESKALDIQLAHDDHNAPALAFTPEQSSIITFWTKHNEDSVMRYRTVNRDTMELGPKQEMFFEENITYAQVIRNGDTLIILTRVGSDSWHYRLSEDWAKSWSEERVLVDGSGYGQNYSIIKPTPTVSNMNYIAFYGHPNGLYRNVLYAQIKMDTGEISKTDGSVIGNIYTQGGPRLKPNQLEEAIKPTAEFKVRVLDLYVIDNSPAIAYAVWDGSRDTPDVAAPATYKIKWFRDGKWITMPWSLPSGEPFGYTPAIHYLGGLVIGYDNTLYSSREKDGTWFLEKWQWSPLQNTFVLLEEIARSNEQKLVRPYASARLDGGSEIIFQRLHEYGDTFSSYNSDIQIYARETNHELIESRKQAKLKGKFGAPIIKAGVNVGIIAGLIGFLVIIGYVSYKKN